MKTNGFAITSTVLVALSLSMAQAGVKKLGEPGSGEARETLKDIQQLAVDIESQSDELMALSSNVMISPQSHWVKLMALREELNKAGQEISRLESESPAPWERQAIGKATPLLADAATNTRKAIEYFNENQGHLWTADYHGYADRIYQDSMEAAKTLRNYLNLAQARSQEDHLEQRLAAPEK